MQIVTLYSTRSAAATGKSLYRAEMSGGSLSYARDLACGTGKPFSFVSNS